MQVIDLLKEKKSTDRETDSNNSNSCLEDDTNKLSDQAPSDPNHGNNPPFISKKNNIRLRTTFETLLYFHIEFKISYLLIIIIIVAVIFKMVEKFYNSQLGTLSSFKEKVWLKNLLVR